MTLLRQFTWTILRVFQGCVILRLGHQLFMPSWQVEGFLFVPLYVVSCFETLHQKVKCLKNITNYGTYLTIVVYIEHPRAEIMARTRCLVCKQANSNEILNNLWAKSGIYVGWYLCWHLNQSRRGWGVGNSDLFRRLWDLSTQEIKHQAWPLKKRLAGEHWDEGRKPASSLISATGQLCHLSYRAT